MSLKNIVYIDYEKVYSLSSQLFEGIIQSAIEQQESTLSNVDALEIKTEKKSSSSSDTNKLSTVVNPHDYHYLKFEKELIRLGLLSSVSSNDFSAEKIKSGSFIKINANIEIADYNKLKDTTNNFTSLGYAIHYVNRYEQLEQIEALLNEKGLTQPHKKELMNLKSEVLKGIENDSAKEKKKFFDNLSNVLSYAYGDELEISQSINNYKFTSFLVRNFFKLSPEMLVKLYSRKTKSPFTIVGIITQSHTDSKNETVRDANDIRGAVWNMNDAMANLESTFCMPHENEYFIEPIALYTEI
ncbi:DUF6414 family protein [Klebsiella pasteurii]|uniref:DUF6414 family protein n=1 Tax=Klebsiella pasteurii TaxID=2587529 RepID=UPI00115AF1C9|nr:hypothetical protein [Klebsiella pasteurii]QUE97091.1 hypothetical protein KCG39_03000 [Klebsiella pasteurii]VUS24513.1 hypothetical protein SB6414_00018 [Klebsiella pasteurii]